MDDFDQEHTQGNGITLGNIVEITLIHCREFLCPAIGLFAEAQQQDFADLLIVKLGQKIAYGFLGQRVGQTRCFAGCLLCLQTLGLSVDRWCSKHGQERQNQCQTQTGTLQG